MAAPNNAGTNNTRKARAARHVNLRLLADVRNAACSLAMLPGTTQLGTWLGEPSENGEFISMANGLLDVQAFLRGEDRFLRPHSPLWFSQVQLPYAFDPAAKCPKWMAFLDRNLGGEGSVRAKLLQQWSGYIIVYDTRMQKFLLMIGEGANGKSVVCAATQATLDTSNCSAVPLERFANQFSLVETLGKLANIVPEVGELDKVAEGTIKAFTSGDLMCFERKHKPVFMARPTARLMLATNNPPVFSDKTDGIWRRMLLLRFSVQIPRNEQVAGMDSMAFWAEERAGILNWALQGLKELRQAGRFIVPDEIQADIQNMRTDNNPARRFLQEHYTTGTGDMPKEGVYSHYQAWCRTNGHTPLASNKFAAEVYRTFRQVTDARITSGGAIRGRVFRGLVRQGA